VSEPLVTGWMPHRHGRSDQPDRVKLWRKAILDCEADTLCDQITAVADTPIELIRSLSAAPVVPYMAETRGNVRKKLEARFTDDNRLGPRREWKISRREAELLRCAAVGMNATETAILLGLQDTTVHYYWRRLRIKLAAKSEAHAVALAIRAGIIP
jgi:DNA-binding CsgD family transcriptional regulator